MGQGNADMCAEAAFCQDFTAFLIFHPLLKDLKSFGSLQIQSKDKTQKKSL
jgi:hypothetical protein